MPNSSFNRWQGTRSSSKVGHSLSLHTSEVALNVLVIGEVSGKGVLVQIRLQAENFLGNLLVLPLDALQLSLTLVEVQTLCFELNIGDRVTLAEATLRHIYGSLLAS